MSTKRQAITLKRRINRYVKSIHRLYEQYNSEAAQLSITITGEQTDKAVPTDERKPFRWRDYPQAKRQVEQMQERFTADMYSLVENGVRVEWQNANGLQDAMVNQVLQRLGTLNGITADFIRQYQSYYSTNDDALQSFLNRRHNGMNLSQRCWLLSEEYKQGLEAAIACGIQKGTSAVELSKQISKYLVDFPKLRKDYKERFGQAAQVADCEWRAARLARTEINMSYRTAEQERWRGLWFVVGYEIKLSDTHEEKDRDVCDELQGKYPKDFVWNGWHPNCKCYQLPIMMSREEQNAWDGEGEPPTDSKNAVKDLPQNFKDWVKENKERIESARSLPYFIRDNQEAINAILSEPIDLHTIDEVEKEFMIWGKRDLYDQTDAKVFDLVEFKKRLQDTIGKYGITIYDSELTIKSEDRWSFRFQGRDENGEEFELWRQFYPNGKDSELECHHNLFKLPPQAQGKGLSREIFADLYEQYQKLGVRYVSVYANIDVGGYTWAKYGFYANNMRQALGATRNSTMQDFVEDWYNKNGVSADTPFPMHLLANQFGDLLLGSDWEGFIDLQNDEQRELWEKYLQRR